MAVVRFELATTGSLEALNDRADRLGHGRPFSMEMDPTSYLLAVGGLMEMSMRDIDDAMRRLREASGPGAGAT